MISFIIPTLNEEAIIEKTIHSLSGYSGAKEIIVSDGGSSDKTIEIAKRQADTVLIHQGNQRQTIAAGRNFGAAAAQGEYLVFLDADILISDQDAFFSKARELFRADARLVGLTVALRVFPELETFWDKIIFSFLNVAYFVFNNVWGIGAASGEFQMIRKNNFKKIGGFNERLVAGEDHDMFRRLSKIGKTYFERTLTVYHTGRRAHAIGWPKLLWIWAKDSISIFLKGKAASKEWTEIR